MPRVKYSVKQIIHKLREAEVLVAQGQTVKDICWEWNITDPTYDRWRQEYAASHSIRRNGLRMWNERIRDSSEPWPISGWTS